ncbi:MAG: hypothetical protein K2X82_04410 [Gemmataceae bacterium]|nr:hypothetical protein [Gemmataceae bacterium]
MTRTDWPTFGRMLDYLRGLGFEVRTNPNGAVVAERPGEETWFVFRGRPAGEPARGIELVHLRSMLDARGLVTPREFSRFWSESGPRQPEPTPAS